MKAEEQNGMRAKEPNGMRAEEYLNILTEQIRCKMARGEVKEEMRAHIEDQTRAFMSEGMERSEAERMAVREMGDPVETGNELDKIHRPRMPWGMLALIAVLTVCGYLALYLLDQQMVEAGGETQMYVFGNVQRQLFFTVTGFFVMAGVYFVDYTRIAERAEWLLAGLIVAAGVGRAFLGLYMNGAQRWINLGFFTVDIAMLMLVTVPLYAAILYGYRGEGAKAVLKAVFWMLPGSIMAFTVLSLWMTAVLLLTYMIIFAIAVYRGWFRIPRKLCLGGVLAAAVLLPAASALYIWFFSGGEGSYYRDRLAAMFGLTGEEGVSYTIHFVREWLTGSRLLGGGRNLPDIAAMPSPNDTVLAWLAGYCGILAAVAVAGLLLFLLLKFFHLSWRQRNQLGMLMGAGCSIVFLIQAVIYIFNNLGIFYLGNFCPFLTIRGSGTIINYVLFGILLSICRYRNTAPERRARKVLLKNPIEKNGRMAE